MNILFAANELAPFAHTGGLGDVMAALPKALAEAGHSVSVVVPLHRALREKFTDLQKTPLRLDVELAGRRVSVSIWQGRLPNGIMVFAVQRDEFFDRTNLYGNEDGDYGDNAERFAFFARCAVELAHYIEPQVEIIHAHDWHTALIPAYVRAWGLPLKTVFTIHNLAYQGEFPADTFPSLCLPNEYFSPAGVEFYDRVNFLKTGILLSNAVTTVSPNYAKEIQTDMHGFGLHHVLRSNAYKLHGILNGIDAERWNPATDAFLPANYNADDLSGKLACKKALLKKLKFRGGETIPLFGMVARMAWQKGPDLILAMIEEGFFQRDVRLVLLGSEHPRYSAAFSKIARQHKNLKVIFRFDDELAHLIEAGCDFFLMPSEFEPCGLNQFYSMRYGTIPVVRDIGGLHDSVEEWNGKTGTGFRFSPGTPRALLDKIDIALKVKRDAPQWSRLQRNAMIEDFSWKTRVANYVECYENVLDETR